MLRRQRRAIAAGIALAGAALATTGLGGAASGTAASGSSASDSAAVSGTAVSGTAVSGTAVSGTAVSGTATGSGRPSARLVSAPVRIADAATVRLLRPGDHVDVIAVGEAGDDARLVARGVRVARVPGRIADDGGHRGGGDEAISTGAAPEGALVMLSVERPVATALLGAGASGRLALAVSDGN
ncbi:hypothetical protein ABZ702_22390 [Streptomyces cyaneofuscatus]